MGASPGVGESWAPPNSSLGRPLYSAFPALLSQPLTNRHGLAPNLNPHSVLFSCTTLPGRTFYPP